jgi:hypothetical protein
MATIHNLGMAQRGAATSTSNFIRSLGMTVGTTIFGMIQKNIFSDKLKKAFEGFGPMTGKSGVNSNQILLEKTRSHIPAPILHKITDILSTSIVHTFMWGLVPAVLALLFIFVMSNERLVFDKPVKKATIEQ